MEQDLQGKTFLVTGANSGIGRATALRLAQDGADVAISFVSRAKEAEETVAAIQALGRRSFCLPCNVAKKEDVQSLVDNTRNHSLLQTKLLELGHPNAQFKFIKAEAPARAEAPAAASLPPQTGASGAKTAAPGPARSAVAQAGKEKLAVPFDKESFKNDPLIQKALEVFKGQIVEVRA